MKLATCCWTGAGIAVCGCLLLVGSCSRGKPPGEGILPEGRWEIRVNDTMGKPVVGATLVPEWEGRRRERDSSFDEFRKSGVVKTDTEGRAVLTRHMYVLVPAGLDWKRWTVRVSAVGYEDVSVSINDIFPKREGMEIVLNPRRS